jgi:hypothetical protein
VHLLNKEVVQDMKKRCIALYSGGLDSILAIKILQDQGIDVIPLYFCTPFFGVNVLRKPEPFIKAQEEKFGITPHVIDYTDDMIQIVGRPRHGYGKHLNPCIDCKIGMLKRAKDLMNTMGASFVITGEVLMQRPMSQRRQIMRSIEKESGLLDILLRPLCAQNLAETLPERIGLVKRDGLWKLSGRGRKVQIEQALAYGISEEDIPTPAGGCLLTDENISHRIQHTFERCSPSLPGRQDIMLDIIGRKFVLHDSTIVVVSRDEEENEILSTMKYSGNTFLKISDVPGPLCIIRGALTKEDLSLSAGICLRYSKARGNTGHVALYGDDPFIMNKTVEAPVLTPEYCRAL